ncbi:MAG: hypothetical protein JXN59_19385 [Anaerolineae bacterium]|nr:hypothetical protein [Anaerolineae bacterium]
MTAQIHEGLILDGEQTSMAFCPPLPEGHPRLIELDDYETRDGSPIILSSTACWRRYQANWEVKNGAFYLVGIQGRYRLEGDEPLLADWFSGVLRIPRGEMLQYVHMGFGSVYEEEVHIKIRKGRVVKRRIIDNRGKDFNARELGWLNLPGGEHRFPGDDDW